jgi:hypothetical protein
MRRRFFVQRFSGWTTLYLCAEAELPHGLCAASESAIFAKINTIAPKLCHIYNIKRMLSISVSQLMFCTEHRLYSASDNAREAL